MEGLDLVGQRWKFPTTRAGAYGLIVTVALLVRVGGLFVYGIDQSGDAVEYDRIAWNVEQGHGYSLSTSAPFSWTTQREPSYPLFLALIYSLLGHHAAAVVILQCLLGVVACLVIYEIARLIYEDHFVACVAGAVNAVYVPIVIFNFRLYSETMAIVLMAGIAYLFVRLEARPSSWKCYAVLGMVMGLLALTKSVFLLLPAVMLPLLALKIRDTSRTVWRAATCLGAMALVLMPWALINRAVHGSLVFGQSVRMAANLYGRVQNDGMKAPGHDVYESFLELERGGMSTHAINERYVSQALDIIRRHPVRYAVGTLREIRDLWRFGVSEAEIDVRGPITVRGRRGAVFLGVKYAFLTVNFVVLVMGLLGLFLERNIRTGIVMRSSGIRHSC